MCVLYMDVARDDDAGFGGNTGNDDSHSAIRRRRASERADGEKKGETFFEREEKIPLQPIEFLYRIVSRVLYYSFCVFKKIGALLLLLFLTSSAFFLRGTGRQFFDGLQVFV